MLSKKIKTILLFCSWCISLTTFSQESISVVKKDSIYLDKIDTFIGRDNFENYYYIFDNQLYKKEKKKTINYINISLGKLAKVCIENPLQIILLYESFNTVVILDKQLSEVQKIDFNLSNPFLKISHIGFSGQNKMWFFDSITQRFGLYDLKTAAITFLSNSINSNITELNSNYNFFNYIEAQQNHYSISIFGKIKSIGSMPKYNKVCYLSNTSIIYSNSNKFYTFDFEIKNTIELDILEKTFTNFVYKDGILSIFTQNKIINYQINF